jgi:hypothetical protein
LRRPPLGPTLPREDRAAKRPPPCPPPPTLRPPRARFGGPGPLRLPPVRPEGRERRGPKKRKEPKPVKDDRDGDDEFDFYASSPSLGSSTSCALHLIAEGVATNERRNAFEAFRDCAAYPIDAQLEPPGGCARDRHEPP